MEEKVASQNKGDERFPTLLGEQLCLDFANMVEPRGGLAVTVPSGYPIRDYLRGYDDLVAWAQYAAVVDRGVARALLLESEAQPDAARMVYRRAVALREAIYRVFWQIAEERPHAAGDLALIAAEHAEGAAHAALAPSDAGFLWTWAAHNTDLARPLWPIAWSATALLTTGDPRRVKVCPGVPYTPVPCAWLFYDTTKNRIRHWCTMDDCGKKSKAYSQTRRRRAARGGADN